MFYILIRRSRYLYKQLETLRLKSDNDYFEMIGSDQDYVGPPGNVLTHVTLRNCCNNLFN